MDDELIRIDGRHAWHYPRPDDGVYAGHYPADSAAAHTHLESLRTQGADYLAVPATGLWWLDHYADFAAPLDAHYPAVHRDDNAAIFALRPTGRPAQAQAARPGAPT